VKAEAVRLMEALQSVSVWRRGSQRAPHKPLLLLMALARIQRGEDRLVAYSDIHPKLAQLLSEFGPPRKSVHPEYPFWRLQNDGDFWEIPERAAALRERGDRPRTGDVPSSVLESVHARGGFSAEAFNLLRRNPSLVNQLTASILEEHFPTSVHEDLLDAVGMPWIVEGQKPSKRSPEFRDEVTRLYEHRCAMCGFDGRLGSVDFALEAAHIMWHAYGGPDQPSNGLLLCSIHHKALDRGALGLTGNRRIQVSQHLHGGSQVDRLLLDLAGSPLRTPIESGATPAEQFIQWHQKEVFRGPPRPAP